MGNKILVTGGQRSGKSSFAEKMALKLSHSESISGKVSSPVYLATAHIWDAEFAKRVNNHKSRRGACWTNIEEERYLSNHDFEGRVVLVDCLTLWATNFFFDLSSGAGEGEENGNGVSKGEEIVNKTLELLKAEFLQLIKQDATFIFVTNEIGMGGVPENFVQRKFTDLLGWFNQFVAEQCDTVYLMTCGIPMKIK